TLLAAFERVAQSSPTADSRLPTPHSEMMLVAGFSGIGKTAVVNEIHKPIVREQGYFIKGKFDQFQRNIPFSALVIAFRDLMEQLLAESDAQLAQWQSKILAALGENGQVIIEVIPELERIIGKQPPVPELSGSAAQSRFNLLFQKFIQVFTTPEHPLVIFLDDLQWADSASLKLMQLLMGESETGYLLLLGAYRDNEVYPAHPLMLTLEGIVKSGASINTITLAPLSQADLNDLVADTLSCSQKLAGPLSELVYQKTKGNPFFATQFLKGLHEDGLIAFDRDKGYWHCDLTEVRQLALTEDVVEFMASRLHKLPEETQEVLKLAACIGNQFDLEALAIVRELEQIEVASSLWKALQDGLVLPKGETYKFFQGSEGEEKVKVSEISVAYKFLHDRVQQAAYSLIPDDRKERTHYRIGKRLEGIIAPEEREERIFELVNQLNHGKNSIADPQERYELARLNLIASRKARTATAYESGREYVSIGLSLLGENPWREQYVMTLAFHDLGAELASLCNDREAMNKFIKKVIKWVDNPSDKVNIYQTKIQALINHSQLNEAIELGLELLQEFNVTFPERPKEKDIQESIEAIKQAIAERDIEDLIHIPKMRDPEKIAIVRLATSVTSAASISGSPLFPLIVSLAVKLSIEYGNTPASAFAYATYGMVCTNLLQDVNIAVKFGRLALKVAIEPEAKIIKSSVLTILGLFLFHRTSHTQKTLPLLQEGYTSGLETGNQEYAGHNVHSFCWNYFLCGQSLVSLEQQTRLYYNELIKFSQLTSANYCRIHLQAISHLLYGAENQSILSGQFIEENEILSQLIPASDLVGLWYFYIHKLIICYLFADINSALKNATEAKKYAIAGAGMASEPAFYFYHCLSIIATVSSHLESESAAWQQLEENQKTLQQQWARHAPMNHQHKWDLIEAEKYRVCGKYYEAGDWYDRAIAGAKENEYLQEEALANELAAKFYLDWGKEKVAAGYMTDAYYCYARWGAKAKTDQLEEKYPQLLASMLQQPRLELQSGQTAIATHTLTQTSSSSTSTISSMLDWATAIKASQCLSSEMHLDKLVSTLMTVAMENAGADSGILLLQQPSGWQVVARYSQEGGDWSSTEVSTERSIPTSVINKVKRTQEAIIINDFPDDTQFAGDSYLRQKQPLSFLCAPILNQGKLIGILYLENHLAVGAFTRERMELLNMLCSQAAISMENARLYKQSQDYAQKLEQSLEDLQQAQLQLVQSEKMSALGNLVAGVAHEINNPVGFIAGNIEPARDYVQDLLELIDLYQQEYPEPSEAIEEEIEAMDLEFVRSDLLELISSMRSGTDRIRHISNSLRTFSRTDKEYKVPFNLHEGLESTLLILKHRLK
ncbi:MAG TPA: serine/threonine protein kinase, partial [Cyanobacteria bacterium UBA11691]|nr:serine/threonine protein kinase [Cyanobacteria bacterium UBA11691]